MRTLVIADGTRYIGAAAFWGREDIEKVVIPASVRVIECLAFERCPNLESVEIAEGVDLIKDAAFRHCKALKLVRLPSTLKVLQSYVFAGCVSLEEIVLPEGLYKIEGGVFENCHALARINVPTTLKKVGYDFGAPALKEVVVPDGVTRIPGQLFCNYSGWPVVLPESLTHLSDNVFGPGNLGAVVPRGCGCESCRLTYEPGGYGKVLDFLHEGERRLASEDFDPVEFCRWFKEVPQEVFPRRNAPYRLLECMKGCQRLLDLELCGTGSQDCLEVLKYFLRTDYPLFRGRKSELCGELFSPTSRTDQAFLDDRRELMAFAIAVKPEAVWLTDYMPRLNVPNQFENIVWPHGYPADRVLIETVGADRASECLLRIGLFGLKVNPETVAMLFCRKAVKCMVAAYRRFPQLQEELPLEKVLLFACGLWSPQEAIGFVQLVEQHFPGTCARTYDADGFSLLWYALCHRRYAPRAQRPGAMDMFFAGQTTMPEARGNWRKLAAVLIRAGCDASRRISCGVSFADVLRQK